MKGREGMFIKVFVEPKEFIIEPTKENIYGSDMLDDCTTRFIKIKGRATVEAVQEVYDDRFNGRFDKNEKYDVVIMLHTSEMGEKAKQILTIKNVDVCYDPVAEEIRKNRSQP